ncbi:MAG: hypothetical protein JKX99_09125 [Robiginitomaculum sp.]|nr:hypothetical protein [Robiginitomaculum sp.]
MTLLTQKPTCTLTSARLLSCACLYLMLVGCVTLQDFIKQDDAIAPPIIATEPVPAPAPIVKEPVITNDPASVPPPNAAPTTAITVEPAPPFIEYCATEPEPSDTLPTTP